MNLLVPGNRFRGGRPVSPTEMKLHRGHLSLVARGEPETLGAGSFWNKPTLNLTGRISDARGWLLRYTPSSSPAPGSDPKVAFLPITELIRALFASSSAMLKQLIDGRRDPTLFRSRFFVDRPRCTVSPDRSVVLHVDREIDREDALVLGVLFADQSGRLLQFHDQINQNLNLDPSFRTAAGAFVDAPWPWLEPVEFEFEGRWLHRVNSPNGNPQQNGAANRFVISRITKIFFPSPPTSIKVRYPSDTTTDMDMPPPNGHTIPATRRAQSVRSDRVPDNARRMAEFVSAGTEFPFAADINISWEPGHVFHGRKDSGMRADPEDGDTFLATDDAVSGGDKATGALNIRRGGKEDEGCPPERSSAEARRFTWKALEQVSDEAQWTISYWGGSSYNPDLIDYDPQNGAADPPRIAIIDKAGTLRAVADLGSGSDSFSSLGVLTDTKSAGAMTLAALVMVEAEGRGWKWIVQNRSGHPKLPKKAGGRLKIKGHRRPQSCWSDERHYMKLLAKWLED